MPYFVIPSHRLRQPRGFVRINPSHWILSGVYDVWAAHNQWRGELRGQQFSRPSSAVDVGTPDGVFTQLNGSSSLNLTGLTGIASPPRSLFVLARTGATIDAWDVAFVADSAGYGGARLQINDAGTNWMGTDGSPGGDTVGGAVATNTTYQIGFAQQSGTAEKRLYINGALSATTTQSTYELSVDRIILGGYSGQDGAWWNGSLGLAIYWNKIVGSDVFKALQESVWQIYVPDRRVLYFGAGGGPSSYSLTADPNTLTLLGIASSLRTSRLIIANPSSLSFSGVSANTLMARKVLANPSSLSLSGSNANTLATRKTVASPGALTLSGSTATFVVGKILVANPGTLSFSGSLANLKREAILSAQPATLTLSGSIAGLFRGKILIADPAALILTGQSAATTTIRILSASPSNLGLVGQNATLSLSGSVQKARPGSDISTGGWLPSSGSDLYAMLDETSYNDSDYIYSPNNPTTETAEVKFTSVTDPGVHTGHILRFRLAAVGLDTVFDVYLMQGATQIATWQKTVTAGNTVSYEETLTSGEASNITDYTDLRIKVVAHA